MERTWTATEARVRFGELLRAVSERGETIIVERHGKPTVAFVSVAEYERLTGAAFPTARDRLRLSDERSDGGR